MLLVVTARHAPLRAPNKLNPVEDVQKSVRSKTARHIPNETQRYQFAKQVYQGVNQWSSRVLGRGAHATSYKYIKQVYQGVNQSVYPLSYQPP